MDKARREELAKNAKQIREATKVLGKKAELAAETELLTAAWAHHSADLLKDYLVRGYQDPVINAQSILWRHFLVELLFGPDFQKELKAKELKFSAEKNRELRLEQHKLGKEFAVTSRGDTDTKATDAAHEKVMKGCETGFRDQWVAALKGAKAKRKLSVIEAACGSANDYRALAAYGLANHFDYTGFDLTSNNIDNARKMFPGANFRLGNVLEIDAKDASYDITYADALFEHLSPAGFEQGIREMCRVAKEFVFINFFYMAEQPDHTIKPLRSYHYNTLSRSKIEDLFRDAGWTKLDIKPIHPWLTKTYGFDDTFNKFTYTFIARR